MANAHLWCILSLLHGTHQKLEVKQTKSTRRLQSDTIYINYMPSGFIKENNHCMYLTQIRIMCCLRVFLFKNSLYNDEYCDYHNLLHLSKVVQCSVVKGQRSHANLAFKWLLPSYLLTNKQFVFLSSCKCICVKLKMYLYNFILKSQILLRSGLFPPLPPPKQQCLFILSCNSICNGL